MIFTEANHLCSFWGYLIFRQTPNDPGHVKAQMNPGWRSCGTFLFLGEGSFWMAFSNMVATLRCFNLFNVYQSVSMLNRPRAADMYQSSRWGIVSGKILWKPQMSQWIFIEMCLRWLHVLCAERADNSLCHRLLLFRWVSSAGHGLGVFAGWGKSPNFITAQQWRSASIVASKSVPFLCSHMGLD